MTSNPFAVRAAAPVSACKRPSACTQLVRQRTAGICEHHVGVQAFKCRKVHMRNGTAGSLHRPLAAGKQLEHTTAAAHSLVKPEPAASAEAQPVKQERAAEQPAAGKRTVATQQRKPAAKRKAAALVRAEATPPAAEGQPAPAGVPELLGDAPLRLVLVGHNPSDHAWCALSNDKQAQPIYTLQSALVACYHAKDLIGCNLGSELEASPPHKHSRWLQEVGSLLQQPHQLDVAAAKGHRHCAAAHPGRPGAAGTAGLAACWPEMFVGKYRWMLDWW
jgi:hypothetical protein